MKKNIIWSLDKTFLENLVKRSNSLNEILKFLNLDNRSYSYKILKKRLGIDNIDFSHIKLGISSNRGRKFSKTKALPLTNILIVNSDYSPSYLKKRLLKENLLRNECYECGQTPEWNGKKLTLQLDHINGTNNDNRLENLRLLCPNCHSQTETFAGRRFNKNKIKPAQINPDWRNAPKFSTRKVIRPSKEELELLILQYNFTALGKKFGVSDNTIRKWCKYYKINISKLK